jgi:sugar lactone lactonase YvrE/outer membrane lipoprotein-sorting protein
MSPKRGHMSPFVLSISLLSTILRQAPPDGQTLMKRIAEAAEKRQSIQFVMNADIEVLQDGMTALSGSTRTKLAFASPGRLRVEEEGVTGNRLQVSDGSTTWTLDTSRKLYSKTAVGPRLTRLGLPGLGWLAGLPVSEIEPVPKIVGEEVIEVGVERHDCWVVAGELSIPESQAERTSDAIMKSWIDKHDLIAVKHEASFLQTADSVRSTRVSMTIDSIQLDADIPAEVFKFQAPSDSREVPSLPGLPGSDLTGTIGPGFEAKDLDGVAYSRDSLRGKPVLLDFWASWCGPCQQSMPEILRIHREFTPRGLVLLSVNVGEDRKMIDAFLKPRQVPYPVILGSDFGLDRTFQISAYPTFILIGRDGKIAGQQVGYNEERGIRPMLVAGVDGPPPASPNTSTNIPIPGTDRAGAARPPASYVPAAVAVDRNGNLYVADSSGARVLRVSPEGLAVVVAGTGIPGNGGDGVQAIFSELNQPASLAVDADGNLYIAEAGAGRIRKVTPDGMIATIPGATQLRRVGGIAVDTFGNLYFSETASHRVRKVTPDGEVSTVAGIGTSGSKGDGGPAIAAQLASPRGLAVDGVGNIYIADTGNHRVRRVAKDGTIVLVAGSGSAGFSGDRGLAVLAQLKNPSGVATDSVGSVYVADSSDYRIRKITTDGMIETVGVTGADVEPASGIQVQVNSLSSIATDSGGHVYLADPAKSRVLSITPDGAVSTVRGTTPDVPAADGLTQKPIR